MAAPPLSIIFIALVVAMLKHISELGNTPTGEPLVFLKPTTALTTDNTLRLPGYSEDIHHEVELVVYIDQDVADDQIPDLAVLQDMGLGLI